MNNLSELLPSLWKLIEKKKCSINISKIDNEIIVSIIKRFRTHYLKASSNDILISKVNAYLQQ